MTDTPGQPPGVQPAPNICRTCAHWIESGPGDGRGGYDERELWVRDPVHHADLDPQPFELRTCFSPKIRVLERPEIDGAAVLDGSLYVARLVTAEGFGCNAWTALPALPPKSLP